MDNEKIIDRTLGKWYILQVLTGQENKVMERFQVRLTSADNVLPVYEVLVPTEKVLDPKRKKTFSRKIFPGYVYIRADLYLEGRDENGRRIINDDVYVFIRRTQGVIGFLGGNEHPVALRKNEVEDLIRMTEVVEDNAPVQAKVPEYVTIGGTVRIIDGAFTNFEGTVEEIDTEHAKLKLLVSIFGRSTPVELEFWQVGPDEE